MATPLEAADVLAATLVGGQEAGVFGSRRLTEVGDLTSGHDGCTFLVVVDGETFLVDVTKEED